ncbi:MAG: Nmad2 family putative nucleotide modification protein [Elusimicrobiota bacterium]
MNLYSYVVARDFGFAPNPFFGVCTLATCKPMIRGGAHIGDWVVGTGSKGYDLGGRVVFAMEVAEVLTFDDYWDDRRFQQKKPNLAGSVKQAFGDNIYHRHPKTGRWTQIDSHHSFIGGRPNMANVRHDTQTPKVLIGLDFIYWGASGPNIPKRFRKDKGINVCAHRGHKCNFPEKFVASFVKWIKSREERGYVGAPAEFPTPAP